MAPAVASIRRVRPGALRGRDPGYTPFWVADPARATCSPCPGTTSAVAQHEPFGARPRRRPATDGRVRPARARDARAPRRRGPPRPPGGHQRLVQARGGGRRQPRIDELADLFIDAHARARRRVRLRPDIAQPYTLRVIMDIYGVPEEDEPLMMDLTQGIFGAADPEFLGDAARSAGAGDGVGHAASCSTSTSSPRTGQAVPDATTSRPSSPTARSTGARWATSSGSGTTSSSPPPGHDTTSFALSGWHGAAAARPRAAAVAAAAMPTLVVNAADEMIRWTSPVRHFLRYAHRRRRSAASPSPRADGCCCRTRRPTATRTCSIDPMRSTSTPARRGQAAVVRASAPTSASAPSSPAARCAR